jgi:hypothetical protein
MSNHIDERGTFPYSLFMHTHATRTRRRGNNLALREGPFLLSKTKRQDTVERFKQSKKTEIPKEADRIFQYYVIFGKDGLSDIVSYLSELKKRPITGLSNNDVDLLLNTVFDDERGYYAYKLGLVKEVVDGVEINGDHYDVLQQFLDFLTARQ